MRSIPSARFTVADIIWACGQMNFVRGVRVVKDIPPTVIVRVLLKPSRQRSARQMLHDVSEMLDRMRPIWVQLFVEEDADEWTPLVRLAQEAK